MFAYRYRFIILICFVLLILWIVFMSLYIHERQNFKFVKTEIQNNNQQDQHDNKLFVIKYNVLPESRANDWKNTVKQIQRQESVNLMEEKELESKAGSESKSLSSPWYRFNLRKCGVKRALGKIDSDKVAPLVCFVVLVENLNRVDSHSFLRRLRPLYESIEYLIVEASPATQRQALTHFVQHRGESITAKYIAVIDKHIRIENNHVLYKYQQDKTLTNNHSLIVWNSVENNVIHTHNIQDLSFQLQDTWISTDLMRKAAKMATKSNKNINLSTCLSLIHPEDVVHIDFVLYTKYRPYVKHHLKEENNQLDEEKGDVHLRQRNHLERKEDVGLANELVADGFVTCNLKGGLGNQLFQIAVVMEYADRFGKIPIFDNRNTFLQESKLETKRDTYFQDVLSWCQFESVTSLDDDLWSCLVETGFNFEELPHVPGNVVLNGYFQSAQYSPTTIHKTIHQILSHMKQYSVKETGKLSQSTIADQLVQKLNISIHIRRTDYVSSDCHISLPMSYYRKSLATIIDHLGHEQCSRVDIIFFSDDVKWCRKLLKKSSPFVELVKYFHSYEIVDTSVLGEHVSSWFDMYLMSLCTHHILANSSYSWWANKLKHIQSREHSITIAPHAWFNPKHIANWDTIYESHFLKV